MAARKVLVVDDDPVVLEMVRDALEELDYEVYTHSSAFGTFCLRSATAKRRLCLDVEQNRLSAVTFYTIYNV